MFGWFLEEITVSGARLCEQSGFGMCASLRGFHYNVCMFDSVLIHCSLCVQEIHDSLDFSAVGEEDAFGIFSVKFSSDGRELVAGSSYDSIHIYDLEANRLKSCFEAHLVQHKI